MLELNHAADLLKDDAGSGLAPSSNALVREAQLLWQGVSAAPEHLLNSFSQEKRGHTLQTAAFSAGITLALSCLKRSPTMAWTTGRVIGPALAVPMLSDINSRTSVMAQVISDTWKSDQNWSQNLAIAKEQIGTFTSDFAIAALASGMAETAGRSYFGLKAPGVNRLPELSKDNVISNWQRHMSGEIIPYRIVTPGGGGARQVDVFIPKNIKHPAELAAGARAESGLLIAQDGLKIDFGRMRNLELPDQGLINLKSDKGSIDYVAAFTHTYRFRVVPGVNLAAWHHEGGLINPGGWFAPKKAFSDANFVTDVHKTLSEIFRPKRSVLAGYSSGAILSNEVAARLGPAKIDAVVSVASTVVGKELPAPQGQFRLFVRDNGDPTLLQNGGAGGKAKILAGLGHRTVLNSVPEKQIAYGLGAYTTEKLVSKEHYTRPNTVMHSFALKDGTPVLSHIRTNTGTHTWSTRESIAAAPPHEGSFFKAFGEFKPSSSAWERVDLNQMVKEIVNGNLSRFSH